MSRDKKITFMDVKVVNEKTSVCSSNVMSKEFMSSHSMNI